LTQQFLVKLAHQADVVAMFLTLSDIAKKMLLLPIGTTSAERSFSAMNWILSSEQCCLTPAHVNAYRWPSYSGITGRRQEQSTRRRGIQLATGRSIQTVDEEVETL